MKPADSERRRLIASIHASAAKLGMDTADKNPASEYRTMLVAVGVRSSTTEMSVEQLAAVVKHLQRTLNAGQVKPKDGWHAEKMRKLWADLAQLRAVKDPSDEGLRLFVESQVQVSALRFLNSHQGNRIVETLKAWRTREAAKAAKTAQAAV